MRLGEVPRAVIIAVLLGATITITYGSWVRRCILQVGQAPSASAAVARIRPAGRWWSVVDPEGAAGPLWCWGRATQAMEAEPVTVYGDPRGSVVLESSHHTFVPVTPALPSQARYLIPPRARAAMRVQAAQPHTHSPDRVALHGVTSTSGDTTTRTDPRLNQRRDTSHRPDLRSFRR